MNIFFGSVKLYPFFIPLYVCPGDTRRRCYGCRHRCRCRRRHRPHHHHHYYYYHHAGRETEERRTAQEKAEGGVKATEERDAAVRIVDEQRRQAKRQEDAYDVLVRNYETVRSTDNETINSHQSMKPPGFLKPSKIVKMPKERKPSTLRTDQDVGSSRS